jgi:hypothetical protein
MHPISKLFVINLSVICLLASGTALAQNPDHDHDWKRPPPSPEAKLARLSEHLDLSNEQSSALLVVLQQNAEDRAALHDQTMAIMGPEICAQRADAEEAILAILTEEQALQLQQMKEEQRGKAIERDHSRGQSRPDCSGFDSGN